MSSIYLSTPPDDDAYISFRYAKNIIDGKGFVYNEGERILGTTTPLFTTILTFTGLSGIAIPSLSIVLCSIFLALTGFVLYFFCREEAKKEAGLASALFIILNPWILQSFGNEMILHLLLHLCAFYYFAKQKFMTSWIFAALALLNRGDGIIIAA
ncbi:hypothetical protein KKB18_05985, partial [bacterium]|nr:hypothetical protein [bacterium]